MIALVTSALLLNSPAAAVDQTQASAIPTQWFEKAVLPTPQGGLPYRVARPRLASRRPLVLVLHGSGAMGLDNESQMGPFAATWAQLVSDPSDPPIVVVPQVARRSADYILCKGAPCESKPGPSFNSLLQLFDRFVADRHVDRRRIYVVGFSMGGSAALQLALARPGRIAGIVAFAPVPPSPSKIRAMRQQQVTVIHGSADKENPYTVMRAWMERSAAAGGAARICVRAGLGHQVPDDMLRDTRWRRELLWKGAREISC